MSSNDAHVRRLTAAAFARLIERLGPDTERAGEAYEALRRALVAFFTWRGAVTPDECADETLDRLAARLEEGVEIQDVPGFARGVARLVLLEHWRRPEARRASLDEVQPDAAAFPRPGDDLLQACLDRCLDELPASASPRARCATAPSACVAASRSASRGVSRPRGMTRMHENPHDEV